MKKILWTTFFWLIVLFGFAFYIRMFDTNMATGVSNWLGVTTISTSGELLATGAQSEVMSGITSIQTTLTDMQTKLDTLVNAVPSTPISNEPAKSVETLPAKAN